MRFASMRNLDISNGENVGVSLFVQGCPFHCKNCFNSDAWDFNGGKEWTEETENKFLELINRPYIKRVSILGGEPLADQNLDGVLSLIKEIHQKYPRPQKSTSKIPRKMGAFENEKSDEIRLSFPEKTIWLYTGFTFEKLLFPLLINQLPTPEEDKRIEIIRSIDVLIDGEYIDEQRDVTLKWRGSTNQRVIDVQKSLAERKVILYCD